MHTFDLGGDKLNEFISGPNYEANPALGWRAIRFPLDVPQILEAQLRAMLRASTRKNISIMLPLITAMGNILKAKKNSETGYGKLKKYRNIFDKKIRLGIIMRLQLYTYLPILWLRKIDFFSIGTNDLIQYTLAVGHVDDLRVGKVFPGHHPAVLKSIKKTIESGHKAGITVGICGDWCVIRWQLNYW